MSRRVAIVTTRCGGGWDEEQVVTRRLAGALACSGDVDILVPAGPAERVERDGAVQVVHLPAFPPDDRRAWALRRAVLGPDVGGLGEGVYSAGDGREAAASLPTSVQEELVRGGGGDSPRLYGVLADGEYDVVVFVGYHRASTHFGMAAVPDRCRVVLWPAAQDRPELHLPLHDRTFARPDAVVAFSDTESVVVERRAGRPVDVLPFALRVNTLALDTEPHAYNPKERYLILASDWRAVALPAELREWRRSIERDFSDAKLRVRLVGPGALRLHQEGGVHLTDSRTDVWRWMSRAVGVLDVQPGRLLGRETVEAMLCGAPVVVHESTGAARDHAEQSNGGLWFRTYDELASCAETLLTGEVRARLGQQGRTYCEERFGDPAAFITGVTEAVVGSSRACDGYRAADR